MFNAALFPPRKNALSCTTSRDRQPAGTKFQHLSLEFGLSACLTMPSGAGYARQTGHQLRRFTLKVTLPYRRAYILKVA